MSTSKEETSDLEKVSDNLGNSNNNRSIDINDHSSSQGDNNNVIIEWSPENETILVEWCDIAQCYKWMHLQAHNNYSTKHAWFTIPAITLSTISGTASFAQASLPVEYQVYAPMVIGTINIMIGIFTTIQQYLKISELNESHRVSAISWDKYARNIRIELAKAPAERMEAKNFLKINRQEFDRLMETSPAIPNSIISDFLTKFKGSENSIERKRFEQLKKPDVCNVIVSADEYRHHWYKDIHNHNSSVITQPLIESMSHKPTIVSGPTEEELRAQIEMCRMDMMAQFKESAIQEANKTLEMMNQFKESALEEVNKTRLQTKIIDDYINLFVNARGRKPFNEEVIQYFTNDVESQQRMDSDFLKKYLNGILD
jgi:hypothetical protein